MSEHSSNAYLQAEPHRLERMQRLIFGRFALIFLLLLASWWWRDSFLSGQGKSFPTSLFAFFLASIALTAVYHVVSYFNRDFVRQKRVQFLVDVGLITWLVWETGNIDSPYVSLYIVLICCSGFLLGRVDSLVISVCSATCLVGVSAMTGKVAVSSIAAGAPPSRIMQVVGFNVVAILFVGLLAARIGERKRISEQLRRSEESFADLNILHERIVQSIGTGLITAGLDGTVYGFNQAAEEITGIDESSVMGKELGQLLGKDISRRIEICLSSVQTEEFGSEHFETQLTGNQGKKITVACSVSPLLRRTGEVSGLIITLQDISQVRALEESLRRADRLAAVGRMAAGLAHEIRNPLGSLSSSLQFLRERANPDEAVLMDVVLRESERLNLIITNFLAYAKPSQDSLDKPVDSPTDIDAAIRDCLVLLKHNPKVSGSHKLNYEPSRMPMRSRVSETELKQVFWNLMQNSINATPRGGDITVKLSEIPGKKIQMIVQDSGPGFAQDNLDHLYEPFSRSASGTGLGLSIVHKIVKENGGRINVDSVRGRGTKVVIELPK